MLERLERCEAKRRWETGSDDWGLLAYSLISMFTIKVTRLSRPFVVRPPGVALLAASGFKVRRRKPITKNGI